MRRRKDANKGEIITKHQQTMAAESGLWPIIISFSLLFTRRAAPSFSCGSVLASSANTSDRRSGSSPRRYVSAANNSCLKFTTTSAETCEPASPSSPKRLSWVVVVIEECLRSFPWLLCTHRWWDTSVSHVPTKMAAKDPESVPRCSQMFYMKVRV